MTYAQTKNILKATRKQTPIALKYGYLSLKLRSKTSGMLKNVTKSNLEQTRTLKFLVKLYILLYKFLFKMTIHKVTVLLKKRYKI